MLLCNNNSISFAKIAILSSFKALGLLKARTDKKQIYSYDSVCIVSASKSLQLQKVENETCGIQTVKIHET